MIFLQLFLTFFIIGLFGFGGGYGMLSLIQAETVVKHHWLSSSEFTNIVAISQMTPGPIGINSATYCGYAAAHNAGFEGMMAVLGSATATFALVLPSFILMVRHQPHVYEVYAYPSRPERLHGPSPGRRRPPGCCHAPAL